MEPGHGARFARLPLLLLLLLLVSGCATAQYSCPRPVSSALYRPEETSIGKKIQKQAVKHPGASGFYLLPASLDAFSARAVLIDRAEKTLDLQYYIVQADPAGKCLIDRILAAAERGVRVRLLVDDWYGTKDLDRWLSLMELSPNIQVRLFNPYGVHRSHPLDRTIQMAFGPKRLKGRMHNKAFIADNSLAIVGGRNIAAEYLGGDSDIRFYDLDILAVGPIAREVSAKFDDYWNCVLSVPIRALISTRPSPDDLEEARRDLAVQREAFLKSTFGLKVQQNDLLKRLEAGKVPLCWAPAEALADDPLKSINWDDPQRSQKMALRLKALIEEARSEVLMVSPYLVPGKAGVRWLKKMRDRDVTLKIITNSLVSNDVPLAQGRYMHYRKDLLRMGVHLYELKPTRVQLQGEQDSGQLGAGLLQIGGYLLQVGGSSRGALHAKSFVLDRQTVFVGSFNFDPRSLKLDTQNGIVIRSPELAAQAADLFAKGASPALTYRVTLKDNHNLVWATEENDQEVQYYQEPLSRFWRRFTVRTLSCLIPESVF